ncbi:hypothetical protein PVL29_000647 [Vitis rotundifolia]|uniref:RRM domain-containing protein n=1 Tax=Vitis rotundifolia TaxID=103349 RepID=A0AA39ALS6_VITRO|nr:hypothetical protein PVL29_000647 [Vitis rotundifolia]
MGETGTSRFLGNLDSSAQEFRPMNPYIQNQMTLFVPTQIYYPYTHPHPYSEVQLMPFCDEGVGYSQFVASSAYVIPVAGKQPPPPLMSPLSATPTRVLLLSSVPTDVSEATVRRELEAFGEVRSVQMERVCDGIVAVSFYDLRHAQACLMEVRKQHMQQQSRLKKHYDSLLTRKLASQVENLPTPLPPPARGLIAGRVVWAQFMIPVITCMLDDYNQGTLVIFNLDSKVSTSSLRNIFETFGSIKELRETPLKRHLRFVEFFDIRDAARALRAMNGKKIQGKHVVIEFSRPVGHGWRFFNAITTTALSSTSSTTNPTVISPSRLAYNTITSRCPPVVPRKLSEKSSHFNVPPHSYLSQPHPSNKKSNVGMNKRSSNAGNNEASMTSLCLTGSVVSGIEDSNGVPRWNPKKSPNGSSTTEQQQQAQRNRPWKGRQKNIDSCFLINEDAKTESHCRDSRTTVMIKNIPNKYSQKLLMNMLDNHCIDCNEQVPDGGDRPLSSYDFVYLPIDFNNKCNVGYGFVNMTSPQATWRLYKAFHLQSWEVFNSTKICEVTYARIQGLEALKEHFKNSKFLCDTKTYLPVVFSPPRDGRQLTEPQPIVGDNKLIIGIITNDTKASDDNDDGDEGEMMMDGPHRLNNGDHVRDCDDDVEDYNDHDQSPNDDDSGDDDEDDNTSVTG